MKKSGTTAVRLPFFARMSENMKKPIDWKLGLTILGGKLLGLAAVVFFMMILPGIIGTDAKAADTYTVHEFIELTQYSYGGDIIRKLK